MKPTDFSKSLQKFFLEYLVHQRGNRANTIKSYRDAFKIFLKYMSETKRIPPHKMLLNKFTASEVNGFRKHLVQKRKNSQKTLNLRMSAMQAFARFLQQEHPENMSNWQRIQSLPTQRCERKPVRYLTQAEFAALMFEIKTDTRMGIRDKAMILVLYDTGARVQELVDLSVSDVRQGILSQATLTGKGGNTRIVPLMPTTVKILNEYMKAFDLLCTKRDNEPLFANRHGTRLTRFGVAYLLEKYGKKARSRKPTIPQCLTPHILRHSKAMHLLEEGCSQVVIQHILGHADLKTTGIYAKANVEMSRKALEKLNPGEQVNVEDFTWQKNEDIMSWLDSL